MTAISDQRPWPDAAAARSETAVVTDGLDAARAEAQTADDAAPLPRRGLLDRDWQKALVVLLTLLAGVALFWVVWQVVSPILHTLVLFALAAVLAFALSGPVDMLNRRVGNRLLAIVAVYLLVGIVVVGGIIVLAGPFVRQASDLASALPQYANDLQARAPEVQTTLGQYGIALRLKPGQPEARNEFVALQKQYDTLRGRGLQAAVVDGRLPGHGHHRHDSRREPVRGRAARLPGPEAPVSATASPSSCRPRR